MNRILPLFVILLLSAVSCSKKPKVDPTASADWRPENASVARHITSVHGFVIGPGEESHLQVALNEKEVTATFRKDVLTELGGEKVLMVLSWEANPQVISRHEYLFFLDALHAYLVLHAPKWSAGEGRAS